MKDIRTIEEYKEDVFNLLTEENKLDFIYTMSKQLCEIKEILDEIKDSMNKNEILEKVKKIKEKYNGDDYDE